MKLLVGTRKGLLIFEQQGTEYKLVQQAYDGVPVVYACHDPRSDTLWASLEHGHWGGKLGRSRDGGKTWDEIATPKYPEGATYRTYEGTDAPATYEFTWCITPSGSDQPGTLYFGTNPGGLFVTRNDGDSFELVDSLWATEGRSQWFGGGRDTPGYSNLLVHPENSQRLLAAISCGGIYHSEDGGANWATGNKGLKADFLPNPDADVGHDPHCVAVCRSKPEVVWQQNHCGIFRSVDGGHTWTDLSQPDIAASFGWVVCADADDDQTAWFVPAQSDIKRMAYSDGLFVLKTTDGGKTFSKLQNGLPSLAYDITYRHGADLHGDQFVFGTTTGNLYATHDAGKSFQAIGHNFAPVSSVRFFAS